MGEDSVSNFRTGGVEVRYCAIFPDVLVVFSSFYVVAPSAGIEFGQGIEGTRMLISRAC